MKAKVCILTTVHQPFDTRIFHKQAKTLVQAGYDVTLIAQHENDEVVDGVKIIPLFKPRNRLTRIFSLTWQAFNLALRQLADAYHFHDPELLPYGVLLKIFKRGKVIYDVHENVPKQILNKMWIPAWSRNVLRVAYMLIERICIPFIDKLVIAEDSYIENYQRCKNVVPIRNYPLLQYLQASWSDTKCYEGKIKVTYVGGVTKLRGALELIEAIKILKLHGYRNIILSLIGPLTPPTLKNELKNLIQQNDLEEYVCIPGQIPHEEVFNVLAQSHIGVAILHPDPNYVESLPTKLFEYMVAALPVVVSNFLLWKKIVEENDCGLTVNPLDTKEIAEAIKYLLTHPEEACRMGENGRRAAVEKYNWELEGKKLLQVYEELLR